MSKHINHKGIKKNQTVGYGTWVIAELRYVLIKILTDSIRYSTWNIETVEVGDIKGPHGRSSWHNTITNPKVLVQCDLFIMFYRIKSETVIAYDFKFYDRTAITSP